LREEKKGKKKQKRWENTLPKNTNPDPVRLLTKNGTEGATKTGGQHALNKGNNLGGEMRKKRGGV